MADTAPPPITFEDIAARVRGAALNLSSYDPADYDGADDVAAVERMMTYDEVDGKWRTTGCS